MPADRQICRVIESDPSSRKILIEIKGKLVRTEKLLGIDFLPGDYACLQSSLGSERTLVVALSPSDLKELTTKGIGLPSSQENSLEHILEQQKEEKKVSLEEISVVNDFEKQNRDYKTLLNKDKIHNPAIMAQIRAIFESKNETQKGKTIKEVFPILAIQDSPEYSEMKDKFCAKADEFLRKNMVNGQSNRDVIQYLIERINRINSEIDQKDFFQSLDFYLDRLRKIQIEKRLSPKMMGVIFYPIYRHYIKRFNRDNIDQWITKNTNKFSVL